MRKPSGLLRDCLGLTVTEVIVSCLMVAIAGTLAASAYSAWLPRYRLKAAARDIYACLQQSKMLAIKNKVNCSVTYSLNPDRYFISGVTKTVNLADYGSGIRFEGPEGQTFSVHTVTFNDRGFSNSGYVYLTNEQKSAYYRVGLSWSTGVVRFQQHGPDGWD
jgi:Tfp pilus assembly protein FimT